MRVALVDNNVIDNVIDAGSIELLSAAHPLPVGCEYIDGAGLNPGDVRDGPGQPWYAPQVQAQGPRLISIRDFLDRLAINEWNAVNSAMHTDATLYRLKDMVLAGDAENPGFINLDSDDLSAGLDYAISKGLIAVNRKAALLS